MKKESKETIIFVCILVIVLSVATFAMVISFNNILLDNFDTTFDKAYDHINSINSTVDQNYIQGWIDALKYMRSEYMRATNVTINSFEDITNQTV